jgi:hypothetical protein
MCYCDGKAKIKFDLWNYMPSSSVILSPIACPVISAQLLFGDTACLRKQTPSSKDSARMGRFSERFELMSNNPNAYYDMGTFAMYGKTPPFGVCPDASNDAAC